MKKFTTIAGMPVAIPALHSSIRVCKEDFYLLFSGITFPLLRLFPSYSIPEHLERNVDFGHMHPDGSLSADRAFVFTNSASDADLPQHVR